MENHKILPFYMTYPLPLYYEDEQEMIKDMEYLQGHHCAGVRALQGEIVKVINVLDYSGSMIYDEYPDRLILLKYGHDIADKIKEQYKEKEESPLYEMLAWEGFEQIVELLLYDEILKRRHRKNRGYLRF